MSTTNGQNLSPRLNNRDILGDGIRRAGNVKPTIFAFSRRPDTTECTTSINLETIGPTSAAISSIQDMDSADYFLFLKFEANLLVFVFLARVCMRAGVRWSTIYSVFKNNTVADYFLDNRGGCTIGRLNISSCTTFDFELNYIVSSNIIVAVVPATAKVIRLNIISKNLHFEIKTSRLLLTINIIVGLCICLIGTVATINGIEFLAFVGDLLDIILLEW